MKYILPLLIAIALSVSANAQFTNFKTRNAAQDSLLERIFQTYLKANDSIADVNHIKMINDFSDSADKYSDSANYYLQSRHLDSCIHMIHIANRYINNVQVLLHIKPQDKWQQEIPSY